MMEYVKLTGVMVVHLAVLLKHQEDALDAAATCLMHLSAPDAMVDADPRDLRHLSLLARSLSIVNERRRELEMVVSALAEEFPVVNTWTH